MTDDMNLGQAAADLEKQWKDSFFQEQEEYDRNRGYNEQYAEEIGECVEIVEQLFWVDFVVHLNPGRGHQYEVWHYISAEFQWQPIRVEELVLLHYSINARTQAHHVALGIRDSKKLSAAVEKIVITDNHPEAKQRVTIY